MIKDTDFAYAAGYIDGDGCFSIGKVHSQGRTRFRNQMIIISTHIENLHWFQSIFGGSVLTRKLKNPKAKLSHRFVLKGKELENFKFIHPFLVEKSKEFLIFENFRSCSFSACKEILIEEMKSLKNCSNLIHTSIKDDVESIRNTVKPSVCDWAYLAGFIDSECCLGIQRNFTKERPNPTYKIQLQCNNTKSPCFFWLSKRFGGQFHFIDRRNTATPQRNQMCWRISSKALFPILENVSPFLKHKKPICDELIKFYKTTFDRKGSPSPNSPGFSDYYRPILEERNVIFHKIQLLNKKGI